MKKLKKLLSFCIVVAIMTVNASAATDSEENYKYKITTESKDWFDYTVLEKNKMLKIDSTELENMTDKQLVYAIADYPYLIDIYVCGTISEGLEKFKEQCSAYNELINRNGGVEKLIEYGSKIIDEYKEYPRADGRTEFVVLALQDMIDCLEEELEITPL